MTLRRAAAASVAKRRLASTTTKTKTQSHQISDRLLEGVHPLHLFRIVQDVDRYHEFLPLCSHSQVFPETIQQGGRFFEADLSVGLGPMGIFQTRYRSKVTVDPDRLTIETQSGKSRSENDNDNSTDGSMFDSLTSSWKLRPVVGDVDGGGGGGGDDAVSTSVDFKVEMTVSDPMVVAVLNQVLENVAETQVQAFYERCLALPKPTPQELLWAERFYDTQNQKTN